MQIGLKTLVNLFIQACTMYMQIYFATKNCKNLFLHIFYCQKTECFVFIIMVFTDAEVTKCVGMMEICTCVFLNTLCGQEKLAEKLVKRIDSTSERYPHVIAALCATVGRH